MVFWPKFTKLGQSPASYSTECLYKDAILCTYIKHTAICLVRVITVNSDIYKVHVILKLCVCMLT